MTLFWTDEDEKRLSLLRRDYEALLARRAGKASASRTVDGVPLVSAASLYEARRLRDLCFPDSGLLFGEPAWDMLLDLYSAHQRGCGVTVSGASLGAGVPGTTGRRWLTLLERLGLVERRAHATDKRTQFVALTPAARATMADYLRRMSD